MNRDEILGFRDFRVAQVDVPEWGGSVWVRTLSLGEQANLSKVIETGKDGSKTEQEIRLSVNLVLETCCDEAGNLLFTPEDYAAITTKSAAALTRIAEAAAKLNGMWQGEEVIEQKKTV